ncbi:BTB/POZ domain-containing protein [Platanthera guangdongensis]|uniref:BTB/POZ domain-containing protein n=1 Tax=Platanthera guangdongensis TaxID=2320717 RepID=A0ABR2MF37_9ASPA
MKDKMSSDSRYLRRRLTKADEVSVSPPFKITVQTFTEVARFCYGRAPTLTPSNVGAVRAAAELLEMEENDRDAGEGSLIRQTEEFFRQEIACDKGRAALVLQCCVGLLPESGEPAAAMAARCVQLLTTAAEEDENVDEWIVELTAVSAESFGMIMESMARWSVHDHDHLYRIADRYFAINKERVSEEEKLRICHAIDCSKLSHHLLLHLVQNSRLPLRFIFKAMLISHHHPAAFSSPLSSSHGGDSSITSLRDLLHHDATARQATNLAVRIESLERDVAGLRRHLRWSEDKRAEMEAGRAKSFRYRSSGHDRSLADYRPPVAGKEKRARGLGRKLVEGFRSLFRVSGLAVDGARTVGESSPAKATH